MNPINILIVDDSITTRMVIKKYLRLREIDCNVTEAIDGKDALDKILNWDQIDFILTDYNMPRMNGLEFIKKIKTIHGTENIPIVMITTESSKQTMDEVFAAGANDYVVKPFTPEDLHNVIAKHFEIA